MSSTFVRTNRTPRALSCPDPFNARNDETNQARGFAYVSGIIDDTTRLTMMTGSSYGDFRIPTQGGLTPQLGLTVNGVSDFNSATLRQSQREYQQFGIISLQKHTDSVDLQTSVFTRNNVLIYSPDPLARPCNIRAPYIGSAPEGAPYPGGDPGTGRLASDRAHREP